VFQPLVIEIKELVAPGGVDLGTCSCNSSRAPTIVSRLTERGGWMRAESRANPPSAVTKKSRLPKCTCAPGTQLTPWLAIRGLMWMTKCAKGPYLARQLLVF
jgi:hypothetical protein